jgi:hypothetical protein
MESIYKQRSGRILYVKTRVCRHNQAYLWQTCTNRSALLSELFQSRDRLSGQGTSVDRLGPYVYPDGYGNDDLVGTRKTLLAAEGEPEGRFARVEPEPVGLARPDLERRDLERGLAGSRTGEGRTEFLHRIGPIAASD